MIKRLLLFVAFVAVCYYSEADGATFQDSGSFGDISTHTNEQTIAVEKSDQREEAKSYTENAILPLWGQMLLMGSILFCFGLWMKYTWLNLELTNYYKWLSDHQRYNEHGKAFYPEPKAITYLFNFRKWMVKDILDPFTESEFRKWSQENTKKVYMGAKCIML
jgi:hypothetical protein